MTGKKGSIVPLFKKRQQTKHQNLSSSFSSSSLQVSKRIIYNNMLIYFLDNNLISLKQSGFRPGDSCANQLLSIINDFFTSFDNGLEVG